MFWIACTLAAMGAAPQPLTPTAAKATADQSATTSPWAAESGSFVVRSSHAEHNAHEVATYCEAWRSKLRSYWCSDLSVSDWTPKCEVVVHADASSYLAAVGRGGGQTFGSSHLRFDDSGRVAARRIDIRGDSPHGLASVPHELTHVVIADLLGGRQPPRWADEGMAMLADRREKQLLHERDLNLGLARQTAFRLADLLTLDSYPHPTRIPAFYGQSASVTAFLALRDKPARFIAFLRQAQENGYDEALRGIYGIANLAELERLWYAERRTWRDGYHGVALALDKSPSSASTP